METKIQDELELAYQNLGAVSPVFIQRKFKLGYKASKELADKFLMKKQDETFWELWKK